ncbi:MGDG synthase family glycosyltransferase [Planosporangium sp. 12N6]|uniref:MGDG synthase family glycosyltransferase n=1 Tax=Planosporangium spinosum TaxID=3402278 RepID=UPI003CE92B7C
MTLAFTPPRRVAVVSASIGAGHDGAARELGRRLAAAGLRIDRYDFLDLLPASLGAAVRRLYRAELEVAPHSWEWLLGTLERHPGVAAAVGAAAGVARRATRRRLTGDGGADLAAVVSTYPLASQVLGQLRRRGAVRAPVVTYLTDLSVHRLWVARGVDLHLALHPVAAEQARLAGADRVRVTAPALAPGFGPAGGAARRLAARRRFGLPAAAPLALVVAGSWGVGEVAAAATDLAATGLVAPVVACGRNETLRHQLAAHGVIALGWTDDMPTLLAACDVVVQNAGGLTSLEALATGVPVLTYRSLDGHGRTNAAALEAAGWIPWVRHRDELGPLLRWALARPAASAPFLGDDPAAVIAELGSFRDHREFAVL